MSHVAIPEGRSPDFYEGLCHGFAVAASRVVRTLKQCEPLEVAERLVTIDLGVCAELAADACIRARKKKEGR